RFFVMQNGIVVPGFEINDPNNSTHPTQIINDLSHDTNARTTLSQVKIFLPPGETAEGKEFRFTLVEESINPQYTGPQARAEKAFSAAVPATPPGLTSYMRRCFKSGVPV